MNVDISYQLERSIGDAAHTEYCRATCIGEVNIIMTTSLLKCFFGVNGTPYVGERKSSPKAAKDSASKKACEGLGLPITLDSVLVD